MRSLLILLLTSLYANAFEVSPKPNINIGTLKKKPSHAVLPNDIYQAACQKDFNGIDENITKKELYMKLRLRGHNIKQLLNDSRYTMEHLKDIYRAVLLLPPWLRIGNLGASSAINYRNQRRKDAVASYLKNKVYLNFNRWGKEFESSMRVSILFHELSHGVGESIYNLDDSRLWEGIESGWKFNPKRDLRSDGSVYRGSPVDPTAYVSNYAMTNPAEDFAESISAYRINPHDLKKASPKKYELIKDVVFLGVEYLDDSQCETTVDDIIEQEELEKTLIVKLNRNRRYYNKAILRLKSSLRGVQNPHPNAIKRKATLYSLDYAIKGIANKKTGTADNFKQMHEYKLFVKSLRSFDQFVNWYLKAQLKKIKK